METLKVEKKIIGTSVQCGRVSVVPIARWSGQSSASTSWHMTTGAIEPIGIQVRTPNGVYFIDLEGRQAHELPDG